MAAAAQQRGLKYIAITDHSKRVTIAGGLSGDQLRRQWAEIDELNKRLSGITVLKGVEVDILERGGLDLPDDVLAEADWVVASVHFGQQQSREQITGRAMKWAYTNENRIGDHIWWISDTHKFKSHYPEWKQKFDVPGILKDMYEKNVERWKTELK